MGEALEACAELETRHAFTHEIDAALDRGPLQLIETRHDPKDALHVADEVALRRQSPVRQPLLDFPGEERWVPPADQYSPEALQKGQCLRRRQRRLVLDRIGNSAQQIGAGYRGAETQGQLGDCQRKGARDMRENMVLIDYI